MKKTIRITVLTALLLTLSLASAGTMAGAKTKNGFTYKVTKNQVKIVSCSKNQKQIVIPNKIAGKKVTSLGANVWKKSSKVQTVVLPKYLKTIEKKQADYAWGNIVKKKNIFSTPFTGCGKLKNIKVAKGNKYFCSAKGVLYTKNKKTLLVYPAGRTQKSYTIQGKTTQIGEAAFEYAKYLQKISYGKKLFYISDGAFFASGLRSVELAKNISNVGLYAFAYSTKLQKVTLGDKVEQINTPFIGCTNLKQFKADKKEIGYYAVNDVLYYKDKEKIVMIGLLKGAIYFFTDLSLAIDLPLRIDFMVASSYGSGTETSGNVDIRLSCSENIEGCHVLLVDDIIDSGVTMEAITRLLMAQKPASVKKVALCDKPSRRVNKLNADYVGFEIPDEFVVGYGLDYAGDYRNLPFIGVLKPEAYAK